MINGKYIAIDEQIAFETIASEKNNPGKTILLGIANRTQVSYNQYLNNFDSLVSKRKSDFSKKEKRERNLLNACYESDTGSFPIIRLMIFNNQPSVLKGLCPYCFLGWPGTMDHYIGQTEFPEYSILAKNLIPCCGDCNRIKGDIWRRRGVRRSIHFYQDTFINRRFLHARIVHHKGQTAPKIHFYLSKNNAMSANQFKIIKNHFKDLNLLAKYDERANARISSEIATLRDSFAAGRDKALLVSELNNSYRNLSVDFGINYWEGILYETLASTRKIINSL